MIRPKDLFPSSRLNKMVQKYTGKHKSRLSEPHAEFIYINCIINYPDRDLPREIGIKKVKDNFIRFYESFYEKYPSLARPKKERIPKTTMADLFYLCAVPVFDKSKKFPNSFQLMKDHVEKVKESFLDSIKKYLVVSSDGKDASQGEIPPQKCDQTASSTDLQGDDGSNWYSIGFQSPSIDFERKDLQQNLQEEEYGKSYFEKNSINKYPQYLFEPEQLGGPNFGKNFDQFSNFEVFEKNSENDEKMLYELLGGDDETFDWRYE